ALYASGILATSAGWLAYSHVAVTDLPLAATFSAALLLCLPWVRSGGRRGLFVAGILLGLAVLAKGLVPLVLIAPLLWIAGRRWPNLLILAGATLAVALPWYVLCYLRNGDAFIDEFFWKHHFSRFSTTDLLHEQPWWFYVPVLVGLTFPWSPMLVLAPHWPQDNRRKLLLMVVGFGFVFFSAATNKLPGYLLPLLPPLAAILGVRLAEATRVRALLGSCAALLLLTPLVAGTLPDALAHGLSSVQIGASSWLAMLPIAALGGLTLWFAGREGRTLAVATVVFTATLGVIYMKWSMFPELDRAVSARPLWRQIEAEPESYCEGDLHRAIRYGLAYYAGKPLPPCNANPGLRRLER
ncbi:MAG TPA: hypothetical protein VER03_12050, partial [Bryobacteraceae bacterium]|nr:hypothetical protein [Bryobacteraceae bacterium]